MEADRGINLEGGGEVSAQESAIGHIVNEPNAVYHANPAISHSKLNVFRKRPILFKRQYIDEVIKGSSGDHFTFGSAFHCAILEPELFGDSYAIQPDEIKRRAGSAWDSFVESSGGREILKFADYELIEKMTAQIAGNPYAMDLISSHGAVRESTFRTGKNIDGISLQCRPDVYNPNGCDFSAGIPYIADVKTVESYEKFERQFYDFGYYRQSPFYRDVISGVNAAIVPQRFFYIVVEKSEPFGCSVLEVDGLAMSEGTKEVAEDLAKFAKCLRENEWPNLPAHGHIGLPEWLLRRMDFEQGIDMAQGGVE